MKTLVLVCLALSVSSSQVPPPHRIEKNDQPQGHPGSSKSGSQPAADATPSTPLIEAPVIQKTAAEIHQGPTETPNAGINWSNWALVGAAIIGSLLALKTLNAIKEQAQIARIGLEATREAASAATAGAIAAKRSAELAERALHLTERADILVKRAAISTHPEFTGNTQVKLVLKNFGRTRGNRVEISSRLLLPGVELEEEHSPADVFAAAVGAGDSLTNAFPPLRSWMPEATFQRIVKGDVVLRFEAEICYFDVFDQRHRTKCSGTFMPATCSFRIDANQEAD